MAFSLSPSQDMACDTCEGDKAVGNLFPSEKSLTEEIEQVWLLDAITPLVLGMRVSEYTLNIHFIPPI